MFYILISYISTIAITKAIDKVSYFSFCKKIYDNGYKFNSEYYDDEEELTPEDEFDSALTFVPGANILNSLFHSYAISSNLGDAIDELIVDGTIVKMERLEEEIYRSKPSIRTIFRMNKLVKNRLKKAYAVKVDNGGKIYYELGDEYSYQVVYKEGSAQGLSYEEIQRYLSSDDLIMYMDELREFHKEVSEASEELTKKSSKKNTTKEEYKTILAGPYFVNAQNITKEERNVRSRKKQNKEVKENKKIK